MSKTLRNKIVSTTYRNILKPIFFLQDPENVHDKMTVVGKFLGRFSATRWFTRKMFSYSHPMLEQNILGINFKNPVGLSAGFDKNAELTDILPDVGFGFAEIGSVTGEFCAGNARPRLWRIPSHNSLLVYYGLKNDGSEAISARLRNKKQRIPIGASVAMTNCQANCNVPSAILDFAKAFRNMKPVSDYITVNISCPNTYSGQPFVIPENLEKLFVELDQIPTTKPVFIKLSPDLDENQIDKILEIISHHRVHGIICTNLTKKRDREDIKKLNLPEVGGMSGKIVDPLADKLLAYVNKQTRGKYILIASGGIFTAEDAYRKIRLGANLLQLITGMIYRGPQVISEINSGLVELLKRDGFKNISEAVGLSEK